MEHDAFLTDELMDEEGDFPTGEPVKPGRGSVDNKTEDGKYKHWARKEPAWKESDIEVDPTNGLRFQWWDVGMTRNATAENRERMKVYLDPLPHVVKDQNIPVRGWYQSKIERPGVRARPCYTDALLTQPYGGYCHVGCGFCYINTGIRGYRGSGLSVVDPKYPEKVRKQISKARTATAFYMSSFIDPFMELEPIYQNTKGTATVALDNGLPMFFLTRKVAPPWVFDYLKANKYSYMQFSLNTSNPDDWQRLSPRAASLETQFEQVREFHRQGIYVSIQVNPIVAGVVSNEDIVKLIHILAQAGADHLIFKFVEIVYSARDGIVRNMKDRFKGARGEAFDKLFTQTIGGFYTIDEDYRKAALEIFSKECKKAGVTMALCYEYEYRRDKAGNILDKTGVSMGGKYLTADQCHGHRVPVFTRDTTDEPWREIKGCPPSGCLTCSEQFPKEVPCHNPYLAEAPAWLPADLKMVASPKRGSQEQLDAEAARTKRFSLPVVEASKAVRKDTPSKGGFFTDPAFGGEGCCG